MNISQTIEVLILFGFMAIMLGLSYWQLKKNKKWRLWMVKGCEDELMWDELEAVSAKVIDTKPKTIWDYN